MLRNKKLGLLTTIGAAFLMAPTATVFAGNTGDTTWTNHYSVFSSEDHTPARRKSNGSAYSNKTKSCSVVYHTIWAALYDGRDVSAGHSYKSYAGQTTHLYNVATENYGKGVSVRINSRSFNNGSASGVWSPDSK
ncbi:hypothetical protein [Lactobacillus sp. LL6]|uniref:hypothetical protein n=1 Tax=Lactobacillus sp. LL6 TaxID=2596827 RepID=UPI00118592C6|nr:hypothetical protein [Lactobacillus sp. LL6]TSO26700.1 hypothetical protein FOD82_06460 [Lactobacillus sp. LL6]